MEIVLGYVKYAGGVTSPFLEHSHSFVAVYTRRIQFVKIYQNTSGNIHNMTSVIKVGGVLLEHTRYRLQESIATTLTIIHRLEYNVNCPSIGMPIARNLKTDV